MSCRRTLGPKIVSPPRRGHQPRAAWGPCHCAWRLLTNSQNQPVCEEHPGRLSVFPIDTQARPGALLDPFVSAPPHCPLSPEALWLSFSESGPVSPSPPLRLSCGPVTGPGPVPRSSRHPDMARSMQPQRSCWKQARASRPSLSFLRKLLRPWPGPGQLFRGRAGGGARPNPKPIPGAKSQHL